MVLKLKTKPFYQIKFLPENFYLLSKVFVRQQMKKNERKRDQNEKF